MNNIGDKTREFRGGGEVGGNTKAAQREYE